ncbi:MAG: hypothetical protein ACREDF_12095 [Thermoplasmata archaeon]
MAHGLCKHAPFATFLALLALATAWLQFHVATYASTLFSLHLFFQIALATTAVAAFGTSSGSLGGLMAC